MTDLLHLPPALAESAATDAPPPMPGHAEAGAEPPDALQVLREVFGYARFRGEQGEVVAHVAAGGDALVLMPTGGGKSLCYQVPAIVRHRQGRGVTLVVSPLIALMHDQVGALEEAGVHAAFLNSTLDGEEARRVERELLSGRLVMLYAAPERILTPRLLAMLDSLHERGLLSLFAIDEAHCVSQWGHDFREEYLGLSVLHERYAGVPRVALTATADAHTRTDILERLSLAEARLFVASFDRPNIRYRIVERDQARAQLLRFLAEEHAGASGIVYCQSRRKVEDTAQWLSAQGVPALPYHAGLDAEVRRANQDRFLREESLVMVATVAFGMGIDKPDVRFVVHLDLPKNIEAYYQETGRAGRDGESADAWMAYGLADVVNQRRMIDEGEGEESFKRLQRTRLEALLALAETHECRRVRLLRYFGEDYAGPSGSSARLAPVGCGNCDNCLQPPATWDATEAARMALSCIYRFQQHSDLAFGAVHLIDVLRGKSTDKTRQHGHEALSTFGIGAHVPEGQWRGVLRQLIALGHLRAAGEYGTLALEPSAREVLRGQVRLLLRVPADPAPARKAARGSRAGRPTSAATACAAATLDAHGQARLAALKAWRAGVAREHGLPAYVIFHDATLVQMAHECPQTLSALGAIGGVGAKKLQAYGEAILQVLAHSHPG